MEEIDLAEISAARIQQLGFKPQKELVYNKLLPYASVLDQESQAMFADVKANLGRAIQLREVRPGCGIWASRLVKYIQLYGFKFSKEDHVTLVKLMYECVTIPKLEPYLVHKFAQVLFLLLKKRHLLSPDDVTLEWRPLYEVVKRTMDSSHTQLGMYRYFSLLEHTLDSLVHVARYYFPDSATQEILDEFKPCVYPLSGTSDIDGFEWFLPVALPPAKAHLGHKLWLNDLMDMWATCNNGPAWEPEQMGLIAKLAYNNIGYIDWEPHIPIMFSRFLASFNLPVNYKNLQAKKLRKLDTSAVAMWIVSTLGGGSDCQKYLDKFLKAIETYFHPANFGRWLPKLKELLWKLPQVFIQRLHMERYQKPSWMTPVPASHKLTEEDVDRFVESIKPVAMQAVFSKLGCADVCVALQHLATLRPAAICPELIDRFYTTLDSLTEPHKLTSVMQCIVGVARPLIQGPQAGYMQGPGHVVPMLMSTLPGIDPNDFRKCIVTFQFIQTFVTLVPLVDCSKAAETFTDLTEEEEELCRLSASFEDFVCQFLDRVFVLVESSSLETTRLDKNENKRSKVENLAEKALTSVCFSVLTQSSPEIFQSALKKLVTFVTGRILETNVAGHFVASLCSSFSRVNSVETFKALLPRLCDTILALTASEDVLEEHDLDDELLYNLLVLSAMVECRREGLVMYLGQLTAVLDRCLYLVSREGYAIAARLLNNMFMTLTNVSPRENRSLNYEYVTGDTKHLPIRDWGRPGNVHDLNMSWHVPRPDEVAAAQDLLARYLPPELERLERHMSGEDVMTRTRLLISLHVVLAVQGAEAMMPLWDEPPLVLIESCLQVSQLTVTLGTTSWLSMPDGRNVRHVIAHTLDRLQCHLLQTAEDDTKAFFDIIKISERLLLNKMRSGGDYDGHYKNHHLVKKVLTNQLVGGKRRVRTLLLDRAILQHEARCEKTGACLTPTHRMLMLNMLKLSCSHYSQVRAKAQAVLNKAIDFFPYCYSVLIPHLVANLQLDSTEAHETIKGSLYVILGPKMNPVVARHDWSMLLQVWPALVRCKPSEKLSVIHLLESLKESVGKHFPTITISLHIPDSCVDATLGLWKQTPVPVQGPPTPAEVEEGQQTLLRRNQNNLRLYLALLDTLCDAAEDNSLHWRHHSIAVCLIRDLVHPELPYPPRVVKLFLDTLISDAIDLRKIAIRSVVHVLKQQKRKHPKKEVDLQTLCPVPLPEKCTPGVRPDNMWLQYNQSTRPLSAEQWDQPRYLHYPGYSYLHRPSKLMLYAPSSEQPPLDRTEAELLPEERPVVAWFSDASKVAKLIDFLALEEKKGKDKFNGFRFILFKGLFRNHGDQLLPLFRPHLDRLVLDKQESSQRCATELIAGLIRGCKHWPYEKIEPLWDYLVPLVQTALSNITEETIQDWGICFATASQNRDPNRNHWLLECLMEDPLRNDTSFMECGRLYVLQSALNQQEWRVAELFHRLLDLIKPFLDHPFENVRRRIASLLTNIFQTDVKITGGSNLGPRVCDFMAEVDARLQILYSLSLTAPEHKDKKPKLDLLTEAVGGIDLAAGSQPAPVQDSPTDAALRLFKTILQWIAGALMRSNSGALPDYYVMYPLACLFESYDQDEELGPICSKALAALAPVPVAAEHLPAVFNAVNKVAASGSWSARLTNLDFIQVVIFHSMPILRSEGQWAAQATQVVLDALEDSRVEVREKAAEVLAGLLHCDFIEDTASLLAQFSKRLRGSRRGRLAKDPAQLVARHAAVLGLCAFVNSSPYDVPDCVAHIFSLLGDHLNDPQPIPSTIRKTLGDFKRTHHDNWESHKLKFTEEQMAVLDDLTVPPSYCA